MNRARPGMPVDAVSETVLHTPDTALSALVNEPWSIGGENRPRAVVVALHGGGMNARYFHGRAHPSVSLLTRAARLGFAVLSVDRPGYGLSSSVLPDGLTLERQAEVLDAALTGYAARHDTGAGFFLVAHSWGAALALTAAAAGVCGPELLGVDVSGISHRLAADPRSAPDSRRKLHWGPLTLYPPGTFVHAREAVAVSPRRELADIPTWPQRFPATAGHVTVPVRLTFADHEQWWRHDEVTVGELTAMFTRTRVRIARQPHAGHNISLGWAAPTYHLSALSFLEECMLRRELVTA